MNLIISKQIYKIGDFSKNSKFKFIYFFREKMIIPINFKKTALLGSVPVSKTQGTKMGIFSLDQTCKGVTTYGYYLA